MALQKHWSGKRSVKALATARRPARDVFCLGSTLEGRVHLRELIKANTGIPVAILLSSRKTLKCKIRSRLAEIYEAFLRRPSFFRSTLVGVSGSTISGLLFQTAKWFSDRILDSTASESTAAGKRVFERRQPRR